jgi:hypothetical protein
MPSQNESRSAHNDFHRAAHGETAEALCAKVDLVQRHLQDLVSQRDGLASETSVLKQQLETLEPEIGRMRAELLQAQEEIERLKACADPRVGAECSGQDAILVFISGRQNPSLRRIANRFGLKEEEARSTLGELQRSDLVSPLNFQSGVQRWVLNKKGMQYLEDRGLLNQTFRQRAPSRIYW